MSLVRNLAISESYAFGSRLRSSESLSLSESPPPPRFLLKRPPSYKSLVSMSLKIELRLNTGFFDPNAVDTPFLYRIEDVFCLYYLVEIYNRNIFYFKRLEHFFRLRRRLAHVARLIAVGHFVIAKVLGKPRMPTTSTAIFCCWRK